MAIAMVAMLAFGGTYAYFTATTTGNSKTVSTGKITLKNSGITLVTGPVVPGNELLSSTISVTNNSTVDSYIFVTVTAAIEGNVENVLTITCESGWTELDKTNNPGVYYMLATPTTGIASTAGNKVTGDYIIDFCKSIKFEADNNYKDGAYDETTSTNADVEGKTITVTLAASSIQKSSTFNENTVEHAKLAYAALNAANT